MYLLFHTVTASGAVMDSFLAAAAARQPPAAVDVDSLSISELKELISKARMSFADCIDKAELRSRAREAAAALAQAPPSQPPSTVSYTQDDCLELLECARYGEDDDIETLRALLHQGVPVDFADDGGNTALHKASANGHVAIVKLLAAAGAAHKPNASGNYPLHWAVQQGQYEATKALLEAYQDIDVLAQNGFGRSVSSEAFAKNDARLVELVLQHPSAEKLEPAGDGADGDEDGDGDGDGGMADVEAEETHAFEFVRGSPSVHLRELAHLGSDETSRVLGASPDEDKTGLQLWAASIVLSHWLLEMREKLRGREVLELGAGCGLCGIVAAKLCATGPVLLTDLAPPTIANMEHNLAINSLPPTAARAASLDWREPKTWPPAHSVVIGADLAYAREAVPDLLRVVRALVAPGGSFLYVAPDCREGEPDFLQGLTAAGFECQASAMPADYLRCVLPERSDEDFEILFAELRERTYSLCARRRPSNARARTASAALGCSARRAAHLGTLGGPLL
jgi:predicted nicotinamide N-methyase